MQRGPFAYHVLVDSICTKIQGLLKLSPNCAPILDVVLQLVRFFGEKLRLNDHETNAILEKFLPAIAESIFLSDTNIITLVMDSKKDEQLFGLCRYLLGVVGQFFDKAEKLVAATPQALVKYFQQFREACARCGDLPVPSISPSVFAAYCDNLFVSMTTNPLFKPSAEFFDALLAMVEIVFTPLAIESAADLSEDKLMLPLRCILAAITGQTAATVDSQRVIRSLLLFGYNCPAYSAALEQSGIIDSQVLEQNITRSLMTYLKQVCRDPFAIRSLFNRTQLDTIAKEERTFLEKCRGPKALPVLHTAVCGVLANVATEFYVS